MGSQRGEGLEPVHEALLGPQPGSKSASLLPDTWVGGDSFLVLDLCAGDRTKAKSVCNLALRGRELFSGVLLGSQLAVQLSFQNFSFHSWTKHFTPHLEPSAPTKAPLPMDGCQIIWVEDISKESLI